VDEVIHPRDTRANLIQAMEMLQQKAIKAPRKKHSNIPL
jgi:propionyl-CoA carboxylase beta chain